MRSAPSAGWRRRPRPSPKGPPRRRRRSSSIRRSPTRTRPSASSARTRAISPAACQALQKAIELNPGLAPAHDRLGRVLYAYRAPRRGHRRDAQGGEPRSAVDVHPDRRGDAHYYAREYEKSVVHYRMALELDPRFDGAHTDLARSLEALGLFDEARAEYEEGRRLSGGVAGPSFGLAHLEAASGNTGRGAAHPGRADRGARPARGLGVGHRGAPREPRGRGRGVPVARDRHRGASRRA